MRMTNHVLQYLFAGILVMMLGGLIGWYIFVHKQITTTEATDTARGLSSAPSFGGGTYGAASGGVSSSTTAFSTVSTGSTGSAAPRLWKVTGGPVAGFGFEASSTRMYFAERDNGNILSADPSLTKISRLTNTLLPKIYEALFASDGSVVLRSLSETGSIVSYAAHLATSTEADAPAALSGVYLPPGIRTIAVRPGSQQLFFLIPQGQNGVTGVTTDWKGGAQKRVFASALKDWQATWEKDGTVYLAQNASDDIPGYAFRLNTSGVLSPLVSGIPGLTVLPRTGSSALLYGSSSGGTPSLYGLSSASSTAVRFNIRTSADKCVWAPGNALIAYCAAPQSLSTDAYFRNRFAGTLHTQDALWTVNVSAGTAEILFRPDSSTVIDAENLAVDPSGAFLGFMNAVDKSLWMLRIVQ